MLITAFSSLAISRRADVIKLEHPSPVTRHLIVRYCRHIDNYSSSCSTTLPLKTCFITEHSHHCLWCTANCSQYQLTILRPSQWNCINTGITARLFARVPDIQQLNTHDNAIQIITKRLSVYQTAQSKKDEHVWVARHSTDDVDGIW